MLTRKQIWLKLKSKRLLGCGFDGFNSEVVDIDNSTLDACLTSNSVNSLSNSNNNSNGNSSRNSCIISDSASPRSNTSTASTLSSSSSSSLRGKKVIGGGDSRVRVKFSSMIQMILIPHRNEYKELQLDLWYSDDSSKESKKNAHREMQWAKRLHNKIDDKVARKILYQPLDTEFKEKWKQILFESATANYSASKNIAENDEIDSSKQDGSSSSTLLNVNHNYDSNYRTSSDSGGSSSNNSNDDDNDLIISSLDEKKRNLIEWLDDALLQSEPKEGPAAGSFRSFSLFSSSRNSSEEGLEEALLRELFDDYNTYDKGAAEMEDADVRSISNMYSSSESSIIAASLLDGESIPYGIKYGRTLHPFSEVKFVQNTSMLYKTNVHYSRFGYLRMKKPNKTFTMDKTNSNKTDDSNKTKTNSNNIGQPKDKIHPLAYLCT